MPKAAIVVLADTQSYESLGRLTNALYAAKEFRDAGDEVTIIFDGTGVKWVGELSKPDHMYHKLYQELRDCVGGVCEYCVDAFKVREHVDAAGVAYANEHEGHPSFRELLVQGYQPITF